MADLIYGTHPVTEALRAGKREPLELLISAEVRTRKPEILELAEGRGVAVKSRRREDLDRLVGHAHHQGLVLRVEPFAFAPLSRLLERWRQSGERAFFLLLDGITDPHNLGAIIRSADAAGCQGVIIPKDRACTVTAVVDKVSAGALEHILLCQETNLSRVVEELKACGVWIYGLAGEGAEQIYRSRLDGDVALVVGAEDRGIRQKLREHCDQLVSIPMAGGVSSLNASVAAAVALFEVVRQRKNTK